MTRVVFGPAVNMPRGPRLLAHRIAVWLLSWAHARSPEGTYFLDVGEIEIDIVDILAGP